MPRNWSRFESAGGTVFFGIEQFREARVFLKKGEILVVAGVIAIFRPELDGNFQIFHGGIGFAGEAIESRKRVMNVVGFGSGLARFIKTFPGVVPATNIHHGHAALVMLVRGAGILFSNGLHALLGNFDVHTRTVREFFAGPLENLFELLLSAGEFLLVKEGKGLVVEFELSLDAGINHFDSATLRRVRSS
ncbi:MAG: hypothetical protein JWO71_2399 [Candidatus Acidoferrum typicum]|nr:hypothetical protein [Candidatus Acidoferrum typicum]